MDTMRFCGFFIAFLVLQQTTHAIDVSTWNGLNSAIGSANVSSTSTTIRFTGNIATPTGFLTPLCIDSPNSSFSLLNECSITIDGNGFALQPGSSYPGFFVGGNPYNTAGALANTSSVTLQNLTISAAKAQGGGSGQGGCGAGLGGGLFVATSTAVTLANVTFTSCSAAGGSSDGVSANWAGGGMAGNASFGGGEDSTRGEPLLMGVGARL